MTLVFTDMVGSTQLKEQLGTPEALALIEQHHTKLRALLHTFPEAVEVETAGDSFFLAFTRPSDAVRFALQWQTRLRRWNRSRREKLADRIGIHVGEVAVYRDAKTDRIVAVNGLEVDKCARVMSLGQAGHILLTRFAFDNARAMLKRQSIAEVGEIVWLNHGHYALKGVAEPLEICEVAEHGVTALHPPPDSEKAHRLTGPAAAEVVQVDRAPPSTWLGRVAAERRPGQRTAWLSAAVTALAGVAALMLPPGKPFADLSYDLAYLFRRVETPAEAVIVRMDRPSHDALGQPWLQPWDRGVHARLIDQMREVGARGVVFDILFDQPASHPDQDAALIAAAKRFGKVVVAGVDAVEVRGGVFIGRRVDGPFPALREVVRWGLVNKADSEKAIRHATPRTLETQPLAVEVARLWHEQGATGRNMTALQSRPWLNFYGPPGTIESFPYSQVLSNQIPAGKFAGKLVFVGAVYDLGYTGGRGTDDFKTPFSRWTGLRSPGVEVTATSCLNLVRGDGLRRLSPWSELLLVTGFGLVAGYGLLRLRPGFGIAAALSGGLLLAVLGMSAVWMSHVWFPWLIVTAVQIPVALVCALGAAHPAFIAHPEIVRSSSTVRLKVVRPPSQTPASGPAAPPQPAQVGPTISHHTMIRPIGRGAYGEVWLARDAVGLFRAVKIVRRQAFSDATPYDREFEGIRQFTPISLRHPGLIHVLHVGRDEERGFFYYVMEAADDQWRGASIDPELYTPRSLEGDMQRHGHLEAVQTVRLGLALCDALQFLHEQRLIHRDLKPANILFVRGEPKLGDIGLVTAMTEADDAVSFVGTKGYMAPEGPGAASADTYSLGKLLYVAVTGLTPATFPELPQDFEQRADCEGLMALNHVLLSACEPEPSRRFPTASALRKALSELRLVPNPDSSPVAIP